MAWVAFDRAVRAAEQGDPGTVDDPRYDRQVGNFPQAFGHMPLIQAALNLEGHARHHARRAAGSPRPH
jgi:GH15 family glucan-1,4-alpha-glucosidase